MHAKVHSARAAELDAFLEKTEKRLQILFRVKELRRLRAKHLQELHECDRELADIDEALREALIDTRARELKLDPPAAPK